MNSNKIKESRFLSTLFYFFYYDAFKLYDRTEFGNKKINYFRVSNRSYDKKCWTLLINTDSYQWSIDISINYSETNYHIKALSLNFATDVYTTLWTI